SFSLAFGDTIIKWADEWLAAGFWKRLTDPVGSAMYALFGGMAESMRKYSEEKVPIDVILFDFDGKTLAKKLGE
ncbi:MAG: hypothetical protein QQN44_03905, partial [Nitrosopumilus sp.]